MSDPLSDARARGLRDAVVAKYRTVAREPGAHFPYPVGRASAEGLGYAASWLDRVPAPAVDGFVGVGNPLRLRAPARGEEVLDLGCGAGLDVFVAALLVGPRGRSVGVDLTPEMVEQAVEFGAAWPHGRVEFLVGSVERLPFDDDAFDRVVSNGALNLVPDKAAAFSEAFRVLRPGGTLAVADLLVTESIPEEVLASKDAWST